MKKYRPLFVFLIMLSISGCEAMIKSAFGPVQMPMTPQEFRELTKKHEKHDRYLIEEFVIEKPFSYVVKNWKKRNKACLTVKIRDVYRQRNSSSTQNNDTTYYPTLIVKKNKATLTVQTWEEGMRINITTSPPEGDYFIVMDALPMKGGKTRITVYRWASPKNYRLVSKSILNWASGKSTACPDLVKVDEYNPG